QKRGRGLLPLFDRGTCRLEGGRRHPRAQGHHCAEHAAGEVSTDPDRLRAGHGRLADRGRPGPRDEPTHRSQQGGADRGRRVARQLSRRASVLLRGGSAAPATGGPARETLINEKESVELEIAVLLENLGPAVRLAANKGIELGGRGAAGE